MLYKIVHVVIDNAFCELSTLDTLGTALHEVRLLILDKDFERGEMNVLS